MKFRSNKLILIFFIIFTLIFISFDKTILASFSEGEEILRGKVVEVVKEEPREDELGEEIYYQQLKVYINSGSLKDKTIDLENGKYASVFNLKLEEGDKIFISYNPEIDPENQFQVEEYDRSISLLLLFAIFVIISVAVAGISGLKSLIGLGISFVIIIKLLIPFLASGANPIVVSLFCALLIGITTFYISHGVSKKNNCRISLYIFCSFIYCHIRFCFYIFIKGLAQLTR